MSEFWKSFISSKSDIDRYLSGKSKSSNLYALTEKGQIAEALPLPVESGTRVSFKYNTGSLLTYDDIPNPGIEGVVVKVKCAEGKVTSTEDGRVFVQWEDGKFRAILSKHLNRSNSSKKCANVLRIKISSLNNISSFFIHSNTDNDELIHKATKDLWSFSTNSSGEYIIERLFDFDGDPIKV